MKNLLKLIILLQLLLVSSCKNKETVETQLKMEVITTTGLQFKYADFKKAL